MMIERTVATKIILEFKAFAFKTLGAFETTSKKEGCSSLRMRIDLPIPVTPGFHPNG